VYKTKFVCFSCRKSFKKTSFADWLLQRPRAARELQSLNPYRGSKFDPTTAAEYESFRSQLSSRYYDDVSVCPECSGQAHDLGRDFRPPPRRDAQAWSAVEAIYALGHRFHTCGCDGPGFIPSNPREYRDYLELRRREYQSSYDAAQACDHPQTRLERSAYWHERVDRIDRAIAELR